MDGIDRLCVLFVDEVHYGGIDRLCLLFIDEVYHGMDRLLIVVT